MRKTYAFALLCAYFCVNLTTSLTERRPLKIDAKIAGASTAGVGTNSQLLTLRQKYTRTKKSSRRAVRTPPDMPPITRSMAAVRSRIFFLCNDGKIYTRYEFQANPDALHCVASNISSTSGGLDTLVCVADDGCIFMRDYDPFASREFRQQFGFFSARYATGTSARFVAVACGDMHIAALDSAGFVWTMGLGPATGIRRQQQPAPTKFERIDTDGFPQGRIQVRVGVE